jgi:hypothetical protein
MVRDIEDIARPYLSPSLLDRLLAIRQELSGKQDGGPTFQSDDRDLLLKAIRGLRVDAISFGDDGPRNATRVLHRLELLGACDGDALRLLTVASDWDADGEPAFLPELKALQKHSWIDSPNRSPLVGRVATATWRRSCPRSSMNSFREHGSRRAVRTPSSMSIYSTLKTTSMRCGLRCVTTRSCWQPRAAGSRLSDECAEGVSEASSPTSSSTRRRVPILSICSFPWHWLNAASSWWATIDSCHTSSNQMSKGNWNCRYLKRLAWHCAEVSFSACSSRCASEKRSTASRGQSRLTCNTGCTRCLGVSSAIPSMRPMGRPSGPRRLPINSSMPCQATSLT